MRHNEISDDLKNEIIDFYKSNNGNLESTSMMFTFLSKWSIRNLLNKEKIYGKVKRVLTDDEKSRQNSLRVINHRRNLKIRLIEYKGGKCIKCNYNKCNAALEFHHLDPNEKDFDISNFSYSFDRLKKEADKCILVCSNCHREIHDEINKGTVV